jgi:predicted lactoylglutathione lyase
MPLQSVWLNLPVKDLEASKKFFLDIGFDLNSHFTHNAEMVCLKLSQKDFIIMLCRQDIFEGFVKFPSSDTSKGSEVFISMDVESREEVDQFAARIEPAGGKLIGSGPGEKDGWLYGLGFIDLDGHRWNILHMDFSKAPGKVTCNL